MIEIGFPNLPPVAITRSARVLADNGSATGSALVSDVLAELALSDLPSGVLEATGDASAATAIAIGGASARTLAARFSDRLNARDYATADGVTADGAALTALGVAAVAAGRDVWVPAGRYFVDSAVPWIFKPGITYYLDTHAMILCHSGASASDGGNVCHNAGAAGNYRIVGGLFRGEADTSPTQRYANLHIYNAGAVSYENVRSEYSRSFGMLINNCAKATISGCSTYRSLGDGISAWATPNVLITGCDVDGTTEEGISTNYVDSANADPRAVVVITNNRVTMCQGITSYGAKMVTIAGNVLRFCFSNGIYVATVAGSGADAPVFGLKIVDNQVFDTSVWPGPSPRVAGNTGIAVIVQGRRAGGGASVPGDPVAGTGVITPLLGAPNTAGTFYNTIAGGPLPGGYWVDVSGNTIARTRPAVASYSQWNGAASVWMGDNAGGTTWAGAVTDANLSGPGIVLQGAVRDSRICDNIIRSGGLFGISVAPFDSVSNGDYDGLEIGGNHISDVQVSGIHWTPTTVTSHKMRIRGNTVDGDPQFKSGNRGTGGTWAADSGVYGIYAPTLNGATYEHNHFRNVVHPIRKDASLILEAGNVYFGNCPVIGIFSATNAGIGFPQPTGTGWQYVQEDSDPRSATYGRILALPASAVQGKADPVATPDLNLAGSGGMAGAWTMAAPTVTSSSGTLTSVTAASRFKKFGRTVLFNCSVAIATNGTGAGQIQVPIPFAAAALTILAARRSDGIALGCILSGSNAFVTALDGSYSGGNGATLVISGIYEATA